MGGISDRIEIKGENMRLRCITVGLLITVCVVGLAASSAV